MSDHELFELSKKLLNQNSLEYANKKELVSDLKKVISYHEKRYYVLNNPVISDFEFDTLYKLLQEIEIENPSLISPDSPTQRISSDQISSFESVTHLQPMLSLANSYNKEDLQEFDKQIRKLNKLDSDIQITYCVEPKYDGGTIVLIYENDVLVRAATRGNGVQGDEMTSNAQTIRSIPLHAKFSKYKIKKVELRGEALIRKDHFKKINEERAQAGLELFANARNTATGGLRTKNRKETSRRKIEAFVYQFGISLNEDDESIQIFNSHSESIDILHELGFKVPKKEKKVFKTIEEAANYCIKWESEREEYQYEIDGMVVKVDDISLQQGSGSTSHHPRWAIAYKFKAKQATTELLNIEYQVGKIGSITPVAKVKPVQLAGVTVSSISLHNEEFIVSKDIRIGDKVVVERAGDVIPYIVKSIPDLRTGKEVPIVFPIYCPINENEQVKLEKLGSEAAWRCPDCTCGSQDLQRMIFHVSKSAMNIDGFGKSYVEKFYELGWIVDLADIYNLDYQKIADLEGFGEKSANNLEFSINKAKTNPIHRLLHSLTIHHLGKRASKLISEQIENVMDLKDWAEEDFINIKDIGPVVARNIAQYFSNSKNVEMLERMESFGVNMNATDEDRPVVVSDDAPLRDKTILFTGTLELMGRKEAQELAEKHGAKNISTVSKNLDILVVGKNAGSKLKKAQSLGSVQILSEQEFVNLIG